MKTKIIGIPGYKNPHGDYYGAGVNHLKFMDLFGEVRIIMPTEKKVKVDLLYLPGGLDLSPDAYGETPGFATSNQDVHKEFFFRNRLKNYVGNTPIFGVCLGFQMLNVLFGGKLKQHLLFHPDSPGRWETAHSVTLVQPDGEKPEEGDEIEFEVNSHHHQAVLGRTLSDELQMLAYTECEEPSEHPDEVIVEAFKHKTLPIAGVQWHPEELYDDWSKELVTSLVHGQLEG